MFEFLDYFGMFLLLFISLFVFCVLFRVLNWMVIFMAESIIALIAIVLCFFLSLIIIPLMFLAFFIRGFKNSFLLGIKDKKEYTNNE